MDSEMVFFHRIVAAGIVTITSLIVSVPSHGTEDAQTVLDGARANWKGIKSVVFHTTYTFDHKDFATASAQQRDVLKTARFEFYIEENHFRTNQRNFNMSGKEWFSQDLAKNDSQYQRYLPEGMALGVSRSAFIQQLPYGAVFTLFDPLDFARSIGTDCFKIEEVQSDAFWNRLKENAKIIDHDSVNGKPTTVLEFATPEMIYSGHPYRAIVHFSDSEDFYPVRYTRFVDPDGWVLTDYSVEETQVVPTADGGTIRVPVRTRSIERGWRDDSPMTIETQTDLGKLQINADIDDTCFTVPLSQVREYYDEDDPSQNWSIVIQESSLVAGLSESIDAAQPAESTSADATPAKPADKAMGLAKDNTEESSGSSSIRLGLVTAAVGLVLLMGGAVFSFLNRDSHHLY
ncbi:MAG TPA: hypothetical protein VMZ06_09460 [Candidatus Bathyarchaeia archaeon]|nr:hypothetical protein [Candidatus Bathyarchaeia archaeon]